MERRRLHPAGVIPPARRCRLAWGHDRRKQECRLAENSSAVRSPGSDDTAAPTVDRPQLGRSLETAAYLARNRKTLWGERRGSGNFVAASTDGVPRCLSQTTCLTPHPRRDPAEARPGQYRSGRSVFADRVHNCAIAKSAELRTRHCSWPRRMARWRRCEPCSPNADVSCTCAITSNT